MTHSENSPKPSNTSIDSFNFSFSLLDKAREDIQSDYDSLSQRIETIVDSEKFYVNNSFDVCDEDRTYAHHNLMKYKLSFAANPRRQTHTKVPDSKVLI